MSATRREMLGTLLMAPLASLPATDRPPKREPVRERRLYRMPSGENTYQRCELNDLENGDRILVIGTEDGRLVYKMQLTLGAQCHE